MASYNKVTFIGNLTRDPEFKTTNSGKEVCEFNIAINGYNEEVLYMKVSVFGKNAENCNKYLRKGSSAMVEGALKVNEWEGENGVKRTAVSTIANSVLFLDGKRSSGDKEEYTSTKKTTNKKQTHEIPDDDEIPF